MFQLDVGFPETLQDTGVVCWIEILTPCMSNHGFEIKTRTLCASLWSPGRPLPLQKPLVNVLNDPAVPGQRVVWMLCFRTKVFRNA